MKKITILVLSFFMLLPSLNVLAQRDDDFFSVNLKEVEKEVNNPKSTWYYPNLLKRYKAFDETLTHKDYVFIYYGFAYQDDYYKEMPDLAKMRSLFSSGRYDDVVKECESVLAKNPIDIEANLAMASALTDMGKPESEWDKYQRHYVALLQVIAASGDGESPKTAFKVLFAGDEQRLMKDFFDTPKILGQTSVTEKGIVCDKLSLAPGGYFDKSEVYFDVTLGAKRTEKLSKASK